MRTYIFIIALIFLTTCKSSRDFKQDVDLMETNIELSDLEKQGESEQVNQRQRIDTLFNRLIQSKFTLCHFHLRYSKRHDYTKMHTKVLDELVFVYGESIENERYIYQKTLKHILVVGQGTDEEDWCNCLMLLPKKDCIDDGINRRLNMLPLLLRDTSNARNTIQTIMKISSILKEPCDVTLNFLYTEINWRKSLFESLVMQIPRVHKCDEEYVGDIYELMNYLPDSLTTNFAYEYIMNNELSGNHLELADEIFDIIEYRYKNWKWLEGYTNFEEKYFDGPNLILSREKNKNLIEKVQEIDDKQECDWCSNFIYRLQSRSN